MTKILIIMTKNKSPKRGKPKIPYDYLLAVSDRLHEINPSKEIVFNTIKSVWRDGYGRGYLRRIDDSNYFQTCRKRHLKESFDDIKDKLDDEIHNKPINS